MECTKGNKLPKTKYKNSKLGISELLSTTEKILGFEELCSVCLLERHQE